MLFNLAQRITYGALASTAIAAAIATSVLGSPQAAAMPVIPTIGAVLTAISPRRKRG